MYAKIVRAKGRKKEVAMAVLKTILVIIDVIVCIALIILTFMQSKDDAGASRYNCRSRFKQFL